MSAQDWPTKGRVYELYKANISTEITPEFLWGKAWEEATSS